MKNKRTLALFLIIVFVFSALSSINPGGIDWRVFAEELGTQEVANPGFDDSTTSPWFVSHGWNDEDCIHSIYTADYRSAPNSLRINHERGGDDLYQTVTIEPNTDYIFSFYAKTEIDNAIRYYVATDAPRWEPVLSDYCQTDSSNGEWKQYAVAFNSGNTSQAIVVISDYRYSSHDSTSYVDDVALSPSDYALDSAKAAAGELDEYDYTAESWNLLEDALSMPEVTNAQMALKMTAINNAIIRLVPVQVYEPIYYVSPNGDDSNDGTSVETAWKTLYKAGSEAQAGDTVIFLDGEYEGNLVPQNSGTADAPITFKAQNQGKVLFKGNPNLTGMQFAISIDGKSYINIDGIHIEMQSNYYGRWLRIRGYDEGPRAHNINITNCLMENATGSPETLNAFDNTCPVALSYCDNIIIKDNIIRELRRMDDMISIKYATGILFEGNEISKAPHVSLVTNCREEFFYEGDYEDENYDNRIYNVRNLVIRNNVFNTQTGRRFSIYPSENVLIEGNIFSENVNGGGNANGADKILTKQGIYRFNRVMRNSIFPIEIAPYDPNQFVENLRIYNNVFAENANCAIFYSDDESRVIDNIIKNNIFYNNDNKADHINMRFLRKADDLELDNDAHMKIHSNLFWHDDGAEPGFVSWNGWPVNIWLHTLSSLQPSNKFRNNINEDPSFVDIANYNFALMNDSPAIDAAEVLTTAVNSGEDSMELIVEGSVKRVMKTSV